MLLRETDCVHEEEMKSSELEKCELARERQLHTFLLREKV